MSKLPKAKFNGKNRFRRSRENSGVDCSTCTSLLRIDDGPKTMAFCDHGDRARKVRLEPELGRGPFYSSAQSTVCDAYGYGNLPMNVTLPTLSDGQAMSLVTQRNDVLHADPNCPYVLEELRRENEGRKGRVRIVDISDRVEMEVIGHKICEMPCCDSRLPFQTWRVDDYRRKAGIRPDGSGEKIWVRKVVDHQGKVNMTPEEAESFFDLSRFDGEGFGDVYQRISAASDYLYSGCNRLGSRPLVEAANPVRLTEYNHFFMEPKKSGDGKLELLVYDERLFDRGRISNLPPRELPEGIILCRDTNDVLRTTRGHVERMRLFDSPYYISGIVKQLDDSSERPGDITHFLDIRAVVYHGSQHMWGVFGTGFNHMESFHEE